MREISPSSDPTCVHPLMMLQFSMSGEFSGAAIEGTAGKDQQYEGGGLLFTIHRF